MDEVFWARTWAYSLLPLVLAAAHLVAQPAARTPARRLELVTMYVLGVGVGAAGLGGAFGHLLLPDVVARSVGWEPGSPFQSEMGFANLALGVLGLTAVNRRDGFRLATVFAVAVIGLGATAVHLLDLWTTGNQAAGNTVQNVSNLLDPLILALLCWSASRPALRREEDDGFRAWQLGERSVVAAAAVGVGVGFGVGYTADAVWLGPTLGVAIAVTAASAVRRNPAVDRASSGVAHEAPGVGRDRDRR